MAVEDDNRGATTGIEPGEARRRNVSGLPNGNHVPKELENKLDEKTKQQVHETLQSHTPARVWHMRAT